MWLRRSDIGSPQLNAVGRQIVENVRRAHGDNRSIEAAAAHIFRQDELLDMNALLAQIVGFGWVAEFVPATGGFFVHFKDNKQISFEADSQDTLKELRLGFSTWSPTDEDPMVKRLSELGKRRGSRRTVRA